MIRNIVIIATLWVYGILAGELDSHRFYLSITSLCVDKAAYCYGIGMLLAIGLVALANLCSVLGWYTFMFVICRLSLTASQLFICFISFASLVFVFTIGSNIWIPCGVLFLYLAVAWLTASCVSLRIFDFNYPVRQHFYDAAALLAIAFFIVSVAAVF